MSQLSSTLAQASQRNHELLSTLSQTDYAAPALMQNIAYITNLQSQIAATAKKLKGLHAITEDERKDHVKYRDSTVKRFMHKLGGEKGKAKFASKQEKEEREFLEAWQKERVADERRDELARALENAENDKGNLESDKVRHDQAQSELDHMYQSIFGGPTPEVLGEDRMEWSVNSARDWYQQCQTQAGSEKHAMEALQRADQTLEKARNDMINAHDMSRMDMWGGGTFTDMMERDALSQAQKNITQSLRHMDEACRTQPAIKHLSDVTIDQGHIMSDMIFDNIFTDAAQHDRIKASEAQLLKSIGQLKGQMREQEQRVKDSQAQLQQASQGLEGARQELQRIRAEACERLAGGSDVPPSYSSYQPAQQTTYW